MKKIQAKTPIKIQNLGLGLNTKNVPYPQKITLDQKFFFISKGPPFYASTFWHFGKSQLCLFTTLYSLTQEGSIPLHLQSPPSFEMQFQLDWQEWRPRR